MDEKGLVYAEEYDAYHHISGMSLYFRKCAMYDNVRDNQHNVDR